MSAPVIWKTEPRLAVDIETMSTLQDAAVCAIGAVVWTVERGIVDEIELAIDWGSQPDRRIDGDTVAWWLRQSDRARQAIAEMHARVGLEPALDELERWLQSHAGPPADGDPSCVWPHDVWAWGWFDFAVLDHAYTHGHDGPPPWPFWRQRDARTAYELMRCTPIGRPTRPETAHVALDDARWTALAAHEALLQARKRARS